MLNTILYVIPQSLDKWPYITVGVLILNMTIQVGRPYLFRMVITTVFVKLHKEN